MFSFEALKAKHGDALLIHYGSLENPSMVIVDGGPKSVFEAVLLPRLEEIAHFRDLRPVPARLVMVSHIDNDHIGGIQELLKYVDRAAEPVVEIESLWHNSFDDDLGTDELALLADLGGVSRSVAASLGMSHLVKEVAAGVKSGQNLRNEAAELGLTVNAGGEHEGFITEGDDINLGNDTRMRVLNPDRGQLFGLQQKWDGLADSLSDLSDEEKRVVLARVVDNSLANISSIVVHIQKGRRSMLLTGDGRADQIVSGMKQAGLLPRGRGHVSILKLPHHGSDRNVNTDFFRTITADHYVFSGDRTSSGSNPDKATFQMLTEARGDAEYAMHFNHDLPEFHEWVREDQAQHRDRRYEVFVPHEDFHGIWIDLDRDELWF